MDNKQPQRLIRKQEVLDRTGMCTSSLYAKVKDGLFPLPVRIGPGNTSAVRWVEAEVDQWIAKLPRAEREESRAA